MTLKQAIRIVENHNKWRRDNNVPPKTKWVEPKKLGVALDVPPNCSKRLLQDL